MTVNLKAVAQLAGVSLATASRVLSGSDYPISDETRERVERAASELHYIPNAQAQGLMHGNPTNVGVLVADVGDPYFSGIITGIHRQAAELGYLVTVVSTSRSLDYEIRAFRDLLAHRVGVCINAGSGIVGSEYTTAMSAMIQAARRENAGAVVIGRHDLNVEVSGVSVDNVEAGRLIGRHLTDLGHRHIALLAGATTITSTVDRMAGLREVVGDGLVVHQVRPTRDGGWNGAAEVLSAHPEITAIAATADQMAIGAMSWLRTTGRSVPDDVSVMGCNDIWVTHDLHPALTTIHVPSEEMGAAALRLGIRARTGEIAHEVLPLTLQVRDSTAPPRPR